MVEIKEINSDAREEYMHFLGKGLIEDEESFRITPADDAGVPFPTLDRDDSFTLGAFVDGQVAGVASFAREGHNREKLRHKGLLFRMYVGRDYRGQGIARQLLEAVVERAATVPGIEQVNLTVVAANERAKALYISCGFVSFALERNAIKWKGKYFDEEQMVLFFDKTKSV